MTPTHEHEAAFRHRSRLLRGWGLALLSIAGILWVWSAVLLVMPYHVTMPVTGEDRTCEAPLYTSPDDAAEKGTSLVEACAAERGWPRIVTVLGTSVPVSAVGAILFTTGAVSLRVAGHAEELTRPKEPDVAPGLP
ncbi:hypothetical protein ABT009_15825 [Streptomyces sp. NPDC002896]|uniref:hypothetical protein n=1 Tax=Streptomyces sp. NPDC002896 TaxID=3154438 RepID=UPI00332AAB42